MQFALIRINSVKLHERDLLLIGIEADARLAFQ